MTIYEITGQFMELLQMAEEGEIDQRVIRDTLEGIEAEFEEKSDGYARVLRQLEADLVMLDAEEERIKERKRTIKANKERIKKVLMSAMCFTGKKKFKTSLFSFSVRKSAPALDTVDEKSVPERFWIPQEPKIDRRALLEEVKAHPEDCSYATLKQTDCLIIK